MEHCKGANGLDKVVLREVRGSSAEVPPTTDPSLSPILFHFLQRFLILISLFLLSLIYLFLDYFLYPLLCLGNAGGFCLLEFQTKFSI